MGRRSVALMLGICSLTGGLFACLFEIMLRLKKNNNKYHTLSHKGCFNFAMFYFDAKNV